MPLVPSLTTKSFTSMTRREFVGTGIVMAGGLAALNQGLAATASAASEKTSSTVPLDWKEVYYTNCPLVSASNVDQELGWTKEEYKKIGVKFAYFRSRRENNWYPHYIHNLDNLIRFGGLFPPIAMRFNSPDINADLEVNLIDVVLFTWDFFGEYHYRSDFVWDGEINLLDLAVMARSQGVRNPYAD